MKVSRPQRREKYRWIWEILKRYNQHNIMEEKGARPQGISNILKFLAWVAERKVVTSTKIGSRGGERLRHVGGTGGASSCTRLGVIFKTFAVPRATARASGGDAVPREGIRRAVSWTHHQEHRRLRGKERSYILVRGDLLLSHRT